MLKKLTWIANAQQHLLVAWMFIKIQNLDCRPHTKKLQQMLNNYQQDVNDFQNMDTSYISAIVVQNLVITRIMHIVKIVHRKIDLTQRSCNRCWPSTIKRSMNPKTHTHSRLVQQLCKVQLQQKPRTQQEPGIKK
jgi:hypothetical protein